MIVCYTHVHKKEKLPNVLLQDVSNFFDVLLGDCARRFETLEMIEKVGVLQQQFLEIMFGLVDDFLLMIVVDLLTIVFRQRFEAFATHKQDTHLRQLFSRRHVAGFFE